MAARFYVGHCCGQRSERVVWIQSLLTVLVRQSRADLVIPGTRQALTQPPSTLPKRDLADPSQNSA
ncbi:uncharacterized protein BDCG_00436 [Blastomyces dermatitidis ER-3]|uniref:Uncharacterized protein n=2 Tax=Ajellomyces dermatitidis TaxID=5039 RepID=A0A0J9HDZ8_AJEDA|nr:uncharacterized protein BDCG_00436 [Blastomyces dermatitidis ER-3]EEQ83631.2 hypothetical protein BDCG_00436 [Blastomyces dermatitidis ER-3]EQL31079.1 hypothetical protein BDFG_06549 [Blastomyces dermatitidis ATCC 26199]KMW67284.1 hypothetical protein BDDG_12027 [Blastomyces dermatitidis ATCC 18188]